jgi:hypothetical protein
MTTDITTIQTLQFEAADSEVTVSSLLRKSKIIATKLDLDEFLTWVDKELNGYGGETNASLPSYRKCLGTLKALDTYDGSWKPVLFEDAETQEICSLAPIGQSIGPLEELILKKRNNDTGGVLSINLDPDKKQTIQKAIDEPTDIRIDLSISVAHGILDAVRISILNWALKLDKAGVTGDGLSFSAKDKTDAKSITQIIFAENISSVGDLYDNATINSKISSKKAIHTAKAQDIVDQIEKSLELLPESIQTPVQDEAEIIKQELGKNKSEQNPSRVSDALNSIKTVCEGAAGNVVAHGIIALIMKYFL